MGSPYIFSYSCKPETVTLLLILLSQHLDILQQQSVYSVSLPRPSVYMTVLEYVSILINTSNKTAFEIG